VQDKYTWIGSQPSLLLALADKIRTSYTPHLVVAAAHGSIMPALVLAELLQVPLYFVRFSMFKRHDEEPIVSLSDQAWLFDFRDKEVILYDEDVAGGRTLESFLKRLSPLFRQSKTACSIRHAGSSIQPDFFGKIWWE
jgi:hypoxanthine phosphoribosyltransferase